jgi:hypothetical protein
MNPVAMQFLKNWGLAFFDPRSLRNVIALPRFIREYRAFKAQTPGRMDAFDTYPCLADATTHTPFDPHYFFQGAWLARKVAASKPELHVDVGSSVVMISTLSAITNTVFIDYRPLNARLANLQPVAGSILQLPLRTGSVESLSCLHVIEHIGLGRYGDAIDARGSAKAARELVRALSPGGSLFISAPVGRERVCFNAHRVFDPSAIPAMMADLQMVEFSFVDDNGRFTAGEPLAAAEDCSYGCGMYQFRKPLP